MRAGHTRGRGGAVAALQWADARSQRLLAAAVAALLAVAALGSLGAPLAGRSTSESSLVSVIVRGVPGSGARAEEAVRRVGGHVLRRLGIIDGVSAEVPASSVARLERTPGVQSVSPNGSLRLLADSFDAVGDVGSLHNTNKIINADKAFRAGVTGKGVDVALIDSGVVPVDGLLGGKVVNGPDLSFESQADNLRYLDTFGHGTHMAGIIAGRDSGVTGAKDLHDPAKFVGVAPDARLVNVKVAAADGSTDVSQVLAAIDWVVQHRNDNGLNIRVLNMAFGTDSTQDYRIDPLAYAAEVAWRKGIVVVVAAGNRGLEGSLNNPAVDPYVIAAGAVDPMATLGTGDDVVAPFSSRGTTRHPDVLAPGRSVVSLRDPGSRIDAANPQARVADRFFRGSGTSQAAAVTSGAAALLLQQRPWLTPDQVKQLLTVNARKVNDLTAFGAGELDVAKAIADNTTVFVPQTWPTSDGTGSLEAARGSNHVTADGVTLEGEQDIFGNPWDGTSWAGTSWSGTSWSGGAWNGTSWSGTSWSGTSWSGTSWSGTSWSGTSWSGTSWSGTSWSGTSWSGTSWSGTSWSDDQWNGTSWSGTSWSGTSWSGTSWSNAIWGV